MGFLHTLEGSSCSLGEISPCFSFETEILGLSDILQHIWKQSSKVDVVRLVSHERCYN